MNKIKYMRFVKFSIVFILLLPLASFGQNTAKIDYQFDDKLENLMWLYRSYNKKNDLVDGYRIQIMFSNDRAESNNAKVKLYREFPTENCYVDYEQPYYKLRMGDYTNRFEANYSLQQILSLYPGAFIIKSKVTAKR